MQDMFDPSGHGNTSAKHRGYPSYGDDRDPHAPGNSTPAGLPTPTDTRFPPGAPHYKSTSQHDQDFFSPALDPVAQNFYQGGHNSDYQRQPSQMSVNSSHNAASNMHGAFVGAPPPAGGSQTTGSAMRDSVMGTHSQMGLNGSNASQMGPNETQMGRNVPSASPQLMHAAPVHPAARHASPQNGAQLYYEPGAAPVIGMTPVLEDQKLNTNSPSACAPAQLSMPDPLSAGARTIDDGQTITDANHSSTGSGRYNSGSRLQGPSAPAGGPVDSALQSIRTYDSVGGASAVSIAAVHATVPFLLCSLLEIIHADGVSCGKCTKITAVD